jgi:hypothetical protein
MILGRLLMRILLVPLGGGIALVVAMMFVMVAHWNRIEAAATDDPNGLMTLLIAPMLALSVAYMLFPSALAVLIAEAFAIRSWMYHAGGGGLSAAVSLATVGAFDKSYDMSDEPLIAIGAGIAAGFAYWAVAGWSAGFWKPVFAPRPARPV